MSVDDEVIAFASSENVRRYACASCGAPVHSTYGWADEFYLHPGSFDEIGVFEPTYELWTIRREPWLPEIPNVKRRYEKSRLQWHRRED